MRSCCRTQQWRFREEENIFAIKIIGYSLPLTFVFVVFVVFVSSSASSESASEPESASASGSATTSFFGRPRPFAGAFAVSAALLFVAGLVTFAAVLALFFAAAGASLAAAFVVAARLGGISADLDFLIVLMRASLNARRAGFSVGV